MNARPNSIGCGDLRPRVHAAAVHGPGSCADRSRAVRRPRHRVGARQRTRPGVSPRRRGRRRRAQDLEQRRGRGCARPGGGRDRTRDGGRSGLAGRQAARAAGCARRASGAAVRAATRPQGRAGARRHRGARSRRRARPPLPGAPLVLPPGGRPGAALEPPRGAPPASAARRHRRAGPTGARRARRSTGTRQRVLPEWERLRAQVVHGDFNLDNLLLDERGRVAGILDFGDCCHTALAADVAVALASFLRGRPAEDAFRVARIALDGFSSRLPARAARGRAARRPRGGAARSDRLDQRVAHPPLPRERRLHRGVGRGLLAAARAVRRARIGTGRARARRARPRGGEPGARPAAERGARQRS